MFRYKSNPGVHRHQRPGTTPLLHCGGASPPAQAGCLGLTLFCTIFNPNLHKQIFLVLPYFAPASQADCFGLTIFCTSRFSWSNHLHHKQIVAQRLAVAGLRVAYGDLSCPTGGPMPLNITRSQNGQLTVQFDQEVSLNRVKLCRKRTLAGGLQRQWWVFDLHKAS